jgi:hypothetical protein
MTANYELNPSSIQPPHEVRDSAKLARLVSEMESNGWMGRPVLVIEECDEDGNEIEGCYVALTGSHRLAAAKQADLYTVPVFCFSAASLVANGYSTTDLWDDDVNLSILREIGEAEAAELMAAEIAANNEEA